MIRAVRHPERKRRISPFFGLICIIAAALALVAVPAAAYAEDYGITVAGTAVTDSNKDDVLGDGGTVSFDPSTRKLTLNNASLPVTNGYAIDSSLSEKDTMIVLQGTNKISGSGGAGGIQASGVLKISGSGSLDIALGSSSDVAITTARHLYIDSDATITTNASITTTASGSMFIADSTVSSTGSISTDTLYIEGETSEGKLDVSVRRLHSDGGLHIYSDLLYASMNYGRLLDVMKGNSEADATPIDGSPFQETIISGLANAGYFHAKDHVHAYDQKVVSDTYKATDATCTEAATYYYSCTCGAKGTGTFTSGSPNGHSYVHHDEAPATCTKAGTAEHYTCENCAVVFDKDKRETTAGALAIAALGHDYVSTVTEPTCTEGGYTTYVCSRCEDTYTSDETAALGHSYASEWSSDAENHWHACTRCGEKADETAHSFGGWIADKEATETESGSKHASCTVCGYTKAEAIPTITKTAKLPATGDAAAPLAAAVLALAGMALACTGFATCKRTQKLRPFGLR